MAITFNDQLKKDTDCVMIVDALNLAFRWKHQGRTDFRYDYVDTVKSLANSYKAGQVIITSDMGASSYRLALSPDYKKSRKEARETQTEEEKMAFEDFFEEYQATLEELEKIYPVLKFRGVEADDIAAHLVKERKKYGFGSIWLVSSDRDWDLLISEDVSRWSYVTRKEVTYDNWSEHYDVTPEQYISLKCLQGDKGDDVPGIPQVGPARALTLLNEYEDAFSIYDAIPLPGKYKYIQNLNNSGDTILLNYELMDLLTYCDTAIGASNMAEIEEKLIG
jgi:5'-3' exonuclease